MIDFTTLEGRLTFVRGTKPSLPPQPGKDSRLVAAVPLPSLSTTSRRQRTWISRRPTCTFPRMPSYPARMM